MIVLSRETLFSLWLTPKNASIFGLSVCGMNENMWIKECEFLCEYWLVCMCVEMLLRTYGKVGKVGRKDQKTERKKKLLRWCASEIKRLDNLFGLENIINMVNLWLILFSKDTITQKCRKCEFQLLGIPIKYSFWRNLRIKFKFWVVFVINLVYKKRLDWRQNQRVQL